jgi:hypothetical protein
MAVRSLNLTIVAEAAAWLGAPTTAYASALGFQDYVLSGVTADTVPIMRIFTVAGDDELAFAKFQLGGQTFTCDPCDQAAGAPLRTVPINGGVITAGDLQIALGARQRTTTASSATAQTDTARRHRAQANSGQRAAVQWHCRALASSTEIADVLRRHAKRHEPIGPPSIPKWCETGVSAALAARQQRNIAKELKCV